MAAGDNAGENARIHANIPAGAPGMPGAQTRTEPDGRTSMAAWLLTAHLS